MAGCQGGRVADAAGEGGVTMEDYKKALFAGIATVLLLPIVIFIIYLSNQGRLYHPNTVDILSFAWIYICIVPCALVFVVFYFKRRFGNRDK
jgi:choline-glycine betaine transporter